VGFDTPTQEWKHFLEGMADLGYGKASGVELICASANRDPAKMDGAAVALVSAHVDVIVATTQFAAGVALRQTHSVSIIARKNFSAINSPAQPAGNVSGVGDCLYMLTAKRMEFLRDAVPGLSGIGIVFRPSGTSPENLVVAKRAAAALSLEARVFPVATADAVGPAIEAIAAAGLGAAFLLPDPVIEDAIGTIADDALRNRLPTMSWDTRHVRQGILLGYSCSKEGAERRLAFLVDRVLNGTPTWTLPLERPSATTLAFNARTAASLGLALPPAVRLFASEFVE
jgi:putative ABC transport system substrate-binding protein